jgi:peptidoglycan/xylan/chitin deacetylase (PgdA/CDA1 family)
MKKDKRMWMSLALAALVIVSGCGAYVSRPIAVGQPPGTVVDDGSKQPVLVDPILLPSDPIQPPAEPVIPPKPAPSPIAWHPRGIGLPLDSEDPRAKDLRVAMLTFDDGPDERYTGAVLDVLKDKKVRAIFFVTGYGAKHKDLLNRIHEEGHILGVHGMTHANLSRLPIEEIREEMAPLLTIIEEVTGEAPKYFRPPFAAYNQDVRAVADELGLLLVNWTNGSRDWIGVDANGYKDPELVVSDVMGQLHRGAVILMHDTKRHTVEALPKIIDQIRAEDYEFVTLP